MESAETFELLRDDQTVTEEVADLVEILWSDKGIRSTFDNRARFGVVDSSAYFFENIRRISSPSYIPSAEVHFSIIFPLAPIPLFLLASTHRTFYSFDTGQRVSSTENSL